jgi:hypothetical protein
MSHLNVCCFSQFHVLISGILKVETFNTESYYDLLTVNGDTFSGMGGPNNVAVELNSSITWVSDHSITSPGFKVCVVVVPSSSPSPIPSPSPSSLPTVNTTSPAAVSTVILVSGPCSVAEGACLLSPNYPSDSGNSQSCEASVLIRDRVSKC